MSLLHDIRAPNRKPATLWQALNPVWWASDEKRNKKWSWWRWFVRNHFTNFLSVIVGVCHETRECFYSSSGWTYAVTGWNYGYTKVRHYPLLPFVSHRGTKWEWCIGWMTSGKLDIEFRRANSPNATETP